MAPDITFAQINEYMERLIPDRAGELDAMEAYGKAQRFPIVGPVAGQLCYQIARMIGAQGIFELGSGYGYSTAWFARAVVENGGGHVHHVVWDDELSEKARNHLGALGFGEIIEFHVGEAVETLRGVDESFDIIFNDIDKHMYPASIPVIMEKLRPGGVLIIDNMLLGGRMLSNNDDSDSAKGVREVTRLLTDESQWISSLIPIRDGLMVSMKR